MRLLPFPRTTPNSVPPPVRGRLGGGCTPEQLLRCGPTSAPAPLGRGTRAVLVRIGFLTGGLVLVACGVVGAASSEHALGLYKDGHYAAAAQEFDASLNGNLSNAQRRFIYLYMGKSYESAGRLDKAIAAYEMAVEYDRSNWRRHRDLAGLYEQVELYTKAINAYQAALRLNKKNEPSLFLALGRTWRKVGLYTYAEAELDEARHLRADAVETNRQLSLVYEGQGRYADALAASLRADDDPKRVVYLAALAGDATAAQQGLALMREKHVSSTTIQAYENLVQLASLSTSQALKKKIDGTSLQELLEKP